MAKYSKKAQDKVEKVMHEMKKGKLRSGSSGKKVTSRKQAIAIGLSEAREAGAKVPKKKPAKKATKKAPEKRGSRKKPVTTKIGTMKRKRAIKKATPKKTVRKKSAKKKGSR